MPLWSLKNEALEAKIAALDSKKETLQTIPEPLDPKAEALEGKTKTLESENDALGTINVALDPKTTLSALKVRV